MEKKNNFPIIKPPEDSNIVDGIPEIKYPEILERHFISLIVGKPGSGKTWLV